ncbi:cytochrome P450 [Citricoccus sp. SGAir0253]|uniref:cytochrome P450 n=1 Tax=Citricoccus sp. SGAir0253 TaxID=2567881 RepID=UPI0010CD5A3E|nr:cytochrome P450 [Citricoccus sp. SGAir0253]QCU76923.1 cytochrome P450 [Citricoccus sp. SGAir0253]
MSCPFAPTTAAPAASAVVPQRVPVPAGAPIAAPLPQAYPEQVLDRHRCVEDPAVVREILRRAEDFVPDNALTTVVPLAPATLRRLAAARFSLPAVLASASGAAHRTVRRTVARYFSPARVAAQAGPVAGLVRDACAGLRDRLGAGGEADLAVEVAGVVPPAILEALTGVPNPPHADLKRWSRDSLELFWGWPDAARQLELAESAVAFHAWLGGAVDDCLAAGPVPGLPEGRNLFAALAAAGVDRDRIRSLGYFLVIAGQETTAMLAQTVLTTALVDGHWAACADPDGGAAAARDVVGSVLAQASSVPTWRRVVAVDTAIGGEAFAAGEHLVLRLSGGGLGSGADTSLAFGFGLHRCLGAGLAEMEAAVILHECARALPGLAGVDRPDWGHLLSFQAPRTVRVRAVAGAGVAA